MGYDLIIMVGAYVGKWRALLEKLLFTYLPQSLVDWARGRAERN